MNEETRRLYEMLDQATSADADRSEPLDPDAAVLSETWATLSRLLETAYPATEALPEPLAVATAPGRRPRALRWAVAIAASLLIAVGLSVAYRLAGSPRSASPDPRPLARNDQQNAADNARELSKADRVPAEEIPSATNAIAQAEGAIEAEPSSDDFPDQWGWETTLDDQLAAVAQVAIWMEREGHIWAYRVNAIERGMDAIQQDIDDETL